MPQNYWVFADSPDGVKVVLRGLLLGVDWAEIVRRCERAGCASDTVVIMSDEVARADPDMAAIIENYSAVIDARAAQ